ncbi:MAG: hypothetical protein ACSLFB_00475 [Acidimicrobiales bacterium]
MTDSYPLPEGLGGLDAAEEQEWLRLKAHLDRAQRFWLGFVFADSSRPTRVLRERAHWNRTFRAQPFVELVPHTPQELAGLESGIEANGAPPGGCTWVEAVQPSLGDGDAWIDAWLALLARLNSRRDRGLRDRLGGLVLVAPGRVYDLVDRYASDLWTVRDLVVDLTASRPPVAENLSDVSSTGSVSYSLSGEEDEAQVIASMAFRSALWLGDDAIDESSLQLALEFVVADDRVLLEREREVADFINKAIARNWHQLGAALALRFARALVHGKDSAKALHIVKNLGHEQHVGPVTRVALLDLEGEIYERLHNWLGAEAAYSESLEIRRRLAEIVGT